MNTWCHFPFRTVMLNSDQTYRVCCNGEQFPNLNLHKCTAEEAFFSPEFESIRQNLKNGIRDPHCKKCWTLEDAGGQSLRLQEVHEVEFNKEEITEHPRIEQIFLGLGNQCNLKCRICSPNESSVWAKEIEDTEGIKSIIYLEPDNSKFISSFKKDVMPYLTEIVFTGGEPALMKSTKKILEVTDSAVEVSLATNGTIKLPDILKKFNTVNIYASTDGIGKRFNYLRHPGNWDEVKENLLSIKYNLCLYCTVSAYNVYYIDEVEEYAKTIGAEFYTHILYDPNYLSVHVFPKEIREVIIKKLSQNPSTQKDKIISLLKEETYFDFNGFANEVRKRDQIRNESFADTFPEFAKILKSYGKEI